MNHIWIILLFTPPGSVDDATPRYLGYALDEESCLEASAQLIEDWPVGSESHCQPLLTTLPDFVTNEPMTGEGHEL